MYDIYDAPQLKQAYDAATASMEAIAREHGETNHLKAAKAFIDSSPAFDMLRSNTPVAADNIKRALTDYFETRPDSSSNMNDNQLGTARLINAWAASFEREIKQFDNRMAAIHPALAIYDVPRHTPAARL